MRRTVSIFGALVLILSAQNAAASVSNRSLARTLSLKPQVERSAYLKCKKPKKAVYRPDGCKTEKAFKAMLKGKSDFTYEMCASCHSAKLKKEATVDSIIAAYDGHIPEMVGLTMPSMSVIKRIANYLRTIK